MPTLGPLEFTIILVIFFIFFGAGKLGQVGGAFRRGIDLFKQNAGIGEPNEKDKGLPPPKA
jgi:Sec-independent protein translocase protein TatA